MMAAMHAPLTLPTEVARSVPDRVEAVGWGAFEGLETARPGLELDVAWCEQRRFKAKLGGTLIAPGEGGVDVVLGFGNPQRLGATTLRLAAAAFASSTGEAKTVRVGPHRDLQARYRSGTGRGSGNRGFLGGSVPLHTLPRRRS